VPESGTRPAGDHDRSGHISASELAGFLDGDLVSAERARVEAHLEGCADCRAEQVEMRRITNGFGKHGSSRGSAGLRRWWIPAIAAAGLATLILVSRSTTPAHREPVRSGAPVGDGEGRARIEVVAPAENATIARDRMTFTWRRAVADAYHISLLNESGEPVWSNETSDTSVALPSSVSLRSGQAYFWRVEAIANGITASTGVHRLRVAP
jgi:hypothetical protein